MSDDSQQRSWCWLYRSSKQSSPLLAAAGGSGQTAFVDDAILIEKYQTEFKDDFWTLPTAGSISVHVNANHQGAGGRNDHWLDFAVGWCGCKLSQRVIGHISCIVWVTLGQQQHRGDRHRTTSD